VLLDVSPIDPLLLPPIFRGGASLACSPKACVLAVSTDPSGRVSTARFDPVAPARAPEVRFVDEKGGAPTVLFDGEHFVVLYRTGQDLGVARLDDGAIAITRVALEGAVLGPAAAPGDGNIVLLASRPDQVDRRRSVKKIDVWSIVAEGFAEPTGSGGSPFVASGGAGCATSPEPSSVGWLGVGVAFALAANRRRRASSRS
jgi:MYXO-CTERM domain-containing protein